MQQFTKMQTQINHHTHSDTLINFDAILSALLTHSTSSLLGGDLLMDPDTQNQTTEEAHNGKIQNTLDFLVGSD